MLDQRNRHVLRWAKAIEPYPGTPQVGVDLDTRDRHQFEALVVDPFQLVGDHFAQGLVHSIQAGVLAP